MKTKTKPSDFVEFPWGSIMGNCESETIARNIMIILKRTGDTFRELSWEEYKAERLKDGHFTDEEKYDFDELKRYCKDAESAISFGGSWAE